MIEKRTLIIKISAAALSLCLSLAAFTFSAGAVLTEADVQSYEDRLEEVKRERELAVAVLNDIQNDQTRAYERIAQLDTILELNEEMRRLTNEQIEGLGWQLYETRQSIADTEKKIAAQKETLLVRMRENYMDSATDYFEVLLSSKSLFDFLKKLDYVDAVLNYDQQLIRQLGEEEKRLADFEQLIIRTEEEQRARLADLDVIIADYRAQEEEKYEYLQSLEQNEQWWTENYAYNQELEDTLNRELEVTLARIAEQQRQEEERLRQLAEDQAKYEAQNTYFGNLSEVWPLEAGVKFRVSSEQGWRVLWGIRDYHRGIDLACPSGTAVYAFNGGTVEKSEYHYSYGNYVLIDHGGGIATLYAHMSCRLVEAGDRVEAGQQVGNVGLTGSTTGYHLHFEVRENGVVVNPRNYLIFP